MRRLLLAVALLFANAATAVPVEEYVATLQRIHSLLEANRVDEAKTEAGSLKGETIEWTGGAFHPDPTIVEPVLTGRRADRQFLQRLELTIAELQRGGAAAPPPDRKLLRQVAAEQKVEDLAAGGNVPTTLPKNAPLLERIAQSIASMFKWIGDKFSKFLDWLFDLFPGSQPREKEMTAGMRWIVIAVTVLIVIVIALLAFEVIRRSKRSEGAVVATSEPVGSKRDEDPLSRGATEWERYAAQLAAAGRYREAIRAWYHAVLVTCYSAGVLHFRKGRTNWEYVATVAPSVPWRPALIELTRRFEREWYGHDESSEDALDDCSESARSILDSIRQRGAA